MPARDPRTAKKAAALKTAGGLPVTVDTAHQVDARPNPLFVYAKAVVAYLVSVVASLTTWSVAIGHGPIDRTGWIALGGAIIGPAAVALGVAITTNADKDKKPTD